METDLDAKSLFEILVRENADMLFAYIRSAVRDHSAAEEIFQDTMLTAWRRLGDYDKRSPFAPWLRGIASKLILAHFRKMARGAENVEEETLEHLNWRFEQLQRLRGDTLDEKLDALRDCLQGLPDSYRQPIELRYKQELRPNAIADRLQLAVDNVKKRLSRAKVRLWDCMQRKLQPAQG